MRPKRRMLSFGPMTALRRKRSLQSLTVAPKPPFGKDAAKGWFEPILTDAAAANIYDRRRDAKKKLDLVISTGFGSFATIGLH